MDKAQAIIYHYGSGIANFSIRASGKMEWEGPGSAPTDEECEQWEAERIAYLELETQHSEAIRLLDESEKKVSSDPAYPDDVPEWKTYRAKLRAIVRSDTLQTIPEKPF